MTIPYFHFLSYKTGFLAARKKNASSICVMRSFLSAKKGSPYPAPALGDWFIETGSLVTSYGLWFGFCFRRLQSFPNDIFYVLPHVFEVVLDVKV